jgi:hypothetical protein
MEIPRRDPALVVFFLACVCHTSAEINRVLHTFLKPTNIPEIISPGPQLPGETDQRAR